MDASNESARPTPASRGLLGGGGVAPAGRTGVLARTMSALGASTWAPVAAKAAAIAAGMVALSAIGAASTLSGSGVPVASASPIASASSAASAVPGVSAVPAGSPAPPASAATGSAQQSPGITADGKVVLNQATVEELVKLPRVGPKRAAAIIDLRRKLGRFRQATDLLRVKGIGRKTLKLMLPNLVVDGG